MPQTPRNTPANSGPGRGTPRSRTTARSGESTKNQRVKPLDPSDVDDVMSDEPEPLPRARRALTATWRLVILLVVIASVGLVLAHSLRVYFAQAQEIAAAKELIAVEEEKIADLQDRLERWNDPEYVRSVARVRLGWVMPGETGYHVLGTDGKPLDGATFVEEEEELGLWWEKLWGSVRVADEPVEGIDPDSEPIPPAASPSPSASLNAEESDEESNE